MTCENLYLKYIHCNHIHLEEQGVFSLTIFCNSRPAAISTVLASSTISFIPPCRRCNVVAKAVHIAAKLKTTVVNTASIALAATMTAVCIILATTFSSTLPAKRDFIAELSSPTGLLTRSESLWRDFSTSPKVMKALWKKACITPISQPTEKPGMGTAAVVEAPAAAAKAVWKRYFLFFSIMTIEQTGRDWIRQTSCALKGFHLLELFGQHDVILFEPHCADDDEEVVCFKLDLFQVPFLL